MKFYQVLLIAAPLWYIAFMLKDIVDELKKK